MSCDLAKIFADLLKKIPHSTDGNECFSLCTKNLPLISEPVTSNQLYIKKATHGYNDFYIVDSPWFFANRETYRQLGLLILAKVFHPFSEKIQINLSDPRSEIKSLTIEYTERPLPEFVGYRTLPYGFVYYAELPSRHPFLKHGQEIPANELPCFGLTNAGFFGVTDEDFKNRDHIKIFGTDKALVNFSELLLNIGGNENAQLEFQLECESGYRGVGISSAEITLWLPGSDAWE